MFYNSFGKSVICNGLLINGSATKSNLRKKSNLLKGEFFGQSFQEKINSPQEISQGTKNLAVFDILLVENVKKLFRQLSRKDELQKRLLICLLKTRIVPGGTKKVSSQLRTVDQFSNGNL